MNDLTKEDLQIISGALWFSLLHKNSDMTANTRIKIQSLIDNYCEPKSSCCSVHAGSSEECANSVSNNSPKIDWSKAKLNEDCRNISYKCGEFYL